MILENVSRNCDEKGKWVVTNEYPFYFIKEMDNKEFQAVSLFFADDVVVVEHHEINYSDIPQWKKDEVKSEVTEELGESFVEFTIVELSLTDGFGDVLYSENYENNEENISEVNEFLSGLGIDAQLEEDDFDF